MPRTGKYVYQMYLRVTYLRPSVMIPLFLCIFILVTYLLGKLIAAGVGRFTVGLVEMGIARVPLVRNVYSAVKQVSGFLLNERKMDVSRVVAVEYPRKGVWAIGLVTGEGVPDIEGLAGEPCLSVMICTSPMPMAGFTINVRRSEVVDLNITLDQAIQFIVSCGVIVPPPHVPAGRRNLTPRHGTGERQRTGKNTHHGGTESRGRESNPIHYRRDADPQGKDENECHFSYPLCSSCLRG